jgi:hypothetical protein
MTLRQAAKFLREAAVAYGGWMNQNLTERFGIEPEHLVAFGLAGLVVGLVWVFYIYETQVH